MPRDEHRPRPAEDEEAIPGETAEQALFRRAVSDVRPLKTPPPPPRPPQPAPKARFRRADDRAVLAESLTEDVTERSVETGEITAFRRARLPARQLDRLRRGEFRVAAEIDLHGLSAVEAKDALAEFLGEALRRDLRCVRVIHGKGRRSGPGGPVLKHAVQLWLARHDAVLGYASARPVDGGTGALYVLLRPR